MLRATLAGLRTHVLRLMLTALAISLGVAFVAGTFVLTGSLQATYDQHFTAAAGKVSVAVLPRGDAGEVPAAALAAVRGLPGVRDAQGQVRGDAPLLGRDGRAYGNASTLGISIAAGPLQRFTVAAGRTPSAPNEVVLDQVTAKRTGYRVGDTVRVLDQAGRPRAFTVAGVMDFGVDQEIGFRGAVGFTGPVAAEMTGRPGFAEIDVLGAPGVGDERLRASVAAAVGPAPETVTGAQLAETLAARSGTDFKEETLLFLSFAFVALFVAALVIYNTFNILIAQRLRELALLRCVGATRRQVFGSVLLESALVGLAASVVGVFGGIGLGAGAVRIFAVDPGPVAVSPVSLVVGFVVGLAVTVGSALLPARAATRVAPMAALRQPTESVKGWAGAARIVLGSLFTVTGLAIGGLALTSDAGIAPFVMVLVAGSLVFLGVIAFSPLIVLVTSRFVGWVPGRLLGVPGLLAGENTRRNPRRTAITTIALTVGVTLMTMFSVALTSLDATTDAALTRQFPVDYRLSAQVGSDRLVPRTVAGQLRGKPQIVDVTEVRTADAAVNDRKAEVGSISQDSLGRTITPDITAGSLTAFRPGTVVLHDETAKRFGVRPGQTVSLRTGHGAVRLPVVATFSGNVPMPSITIDETDFARFFGVRDDFEVYVVVASGVSADESRRVIDAAVQPYPMVKVASAADVKARYTDALDQLFVLVAALLALAIVISLIGIANTLSLSVAERSRESALLRALGLTKGGLRRMLSAEALITSVIGALIGVTLGTVYGWAALQAVQNHVVLNIPVARILAFILLSAIAGVLAAVLPARRAARAAIVTSLAEE